jgi:hypothetical protein
MGFEKRRFSEEYLQTHQITSELQEELEANVENSITEKDTLTKLLENEKSNNLIYLEKKHLQSEEEQAEQGEWSCS